MHSDTGTVVHSDELGIVVPPDRAPELLLPAFGEAETVPSHVLAWTAVYIRMMKDADFYAEQLSWMESQEVSNA